MGRCGIAESASVRARRLPDSSQVGNSPYTPMKAPNSRILMSPICLYNPRRLLLPADALATIWYMVRPNASICGFQRAAKHNC